MRRTLRTIMVTPEKGTIPPPKWRPPIEHLKKEEWFLEP
jgi:hypothetical protein